MKWFFEQPGNVERLLEELKTWRGTPFIEYCGKRGVGADCVRFVESVLVNLGAIPQVRWPRYVCRSGGPEMLQVFVDHMNAVPGLIPVWDSGGLTMLRFRHLDDSERASIMIGDLLLCSNGKTGHHMAIMARPPTLWHSLIRRGVVEGNIADPIIDKHVFAIYRLRA
jgi:cell wall-associated NlpC family hydrolase